MVSLKARRILRVNAKPTVFNTIEVNRMSKYINAFLIGFSANAFLWRLDEGEYDAIIYPAGIFVMGLVVLVVELRKQKQQHNRG